MMNKKIAILTIFVGLLGAVQLWAQETRPASTRSTSSPGASGPASSASAPSKLPPNLSIEVDPRVELMCVVMRLAGCREYTRCQVPKYGNDVDKHFGAFADHPAVKRIQAMRRKYGVGYDAPMSLAVHLAGVKDLKERVPFTPRPEGLDRRWEPKETELFLEELRDFATKAKFQDFFDGHKELYETVCWRARRTLEESSNLMWMEKYFGAGGGTIFIYPAMLNGPCSYGPRFCGKDSQEMCCIPGISSNLLGGPTFSPAMITLVVHELGHSYVNPLVYSREKELRPAGEKMYGGKIAKTMQQLAYGNWQTMMHESINRACVVRYLLANNGRAAAAAEIDDQNKIGFVWVGALSEVLAEYEADRKTYPTLESFMPRIVKFFDDYAKTVNQ